MIISLAILYTHLFLYLLDAHLFLSLLNAHHLTNGGVEHEAETVVGDNFDDVWYHPLIQTFSPLFFHNGGERILNT